MRSPNDMEFSLIRDIFPNAYSTALIPPVLIIFCTVLPQKPWPVTIAGLASSFTDKDDCYPLPLGMSSSRGYELDQNRLAHWKVPKTADFRTIFDAFAEKFNVLAEFVMWMGVWFVITIPLGTSRESLPGMVMGLLCTYKFLETSLPKEAALRTTVLAPGMC